MARWRIERIQRQRQGLVVIKELCKVPSRRDAAAMKVGGRATPLPLIAASRSTSALLAHKGNNLLALHPMAKPVDLVMDVQLDCSRRGEIVLDSSGQIFVANRPR
jgi:hypothetical protein